MSSRSHFRTRKIDMCGLLPLAVLALVLSVAYLGSLAPVYGRWPFISRYARLGASCCARCSLTVEPGSNSPSGHPASNRRGLHGYVFCVLLTSFFSLPSCHFLTLLEPQLVIRSLEVRVSRLALRPRSEVHHSKASRPSLR
jgi:hypothetical protein